MDHYDTDDELGRPYGTQGDAYRPAPDWLEELGASRGAMASGGMLRRVQNGAVARKLPVGYLTGRSGWPMRAAVDPRKGPLVRLAFELVGREGVSLRKALEVVTIRGLRSVSEGKLSPSSLHHILRNPFYRGEIRYKGRTYPGAHEPLVSAELFEAARRHLEGRRT